MLQKLIKAAALAGFVLAATSSAFAASVSYTETGDAGDLVTGAAQTVTGNAGDNIMAIKGSLGLTNGISEADAFKIYISAPSAFSASTTNFAPGTNNFDSELFLFTLGGKGIVMNDDEAANGSPQSFIQAGTSFMASLAPGYYYLLITGSGKNPISGSSLIFPSQLDNVTDGTGTYGPINSGSITGYGGSSNEGGAYSISLTGVTIAPAAVVPEPSTLCLGLAGGLMLLGMSRRRQGKTSAQ